jgi:hypothetical protein
MLSRFRPAILMQAAAIPAMARKQAIWVSNSIADMAMAGTRVFLIRNQLISSSTFDFIRPGKSEKRILPRRSDFELTLRRDGAAVQKPMD